MKQTLRLSQRTATSIAALLRDASSTATGSASPAAAAAAAVTVNGWIRSHRQQKKLSFIDLNDGSNHSGLEAVVPRDVLDACDPRTREGLTTGASISLSGQLSEKKGGNMDGMELRVDRIRLVGDCDGKVCFFTLFFGPNSHPSCLPA